MALTRQQQQYARSCEVARLWARNVSIDQLRKGNADRVAQSYGIRAADALSIIVNAYRERNA